jgi:hypothetical protein
MKYLENVFYLVRLVLLMSLWIALVWIALSVILVRQTYWWMRGDSTPLARTPGTAAATVARRMAVGACSFAVAL